MMIAENLGGLSATANYTVDIKYRDKSTTGASSITAHADSPQGASDVAVNQIRDLFGDVTITAVAVSGPDGHTYQARQINNRWTIATTAVAPTSAQRPLVIAAVGVGILALLGIGVAVVLRRRRRKR